MMEVGSALASISLPFLTTRKVKVPCYFFNILRSLVYYPIAAATHGNKSFDLVSVSDVLLDSSVMKYNPLDCQRPELLNKNLVQGKILLCGYSFNFVSGTASIKKVCETAKSLGAAGFVVAVESSYRGTKYDPVPVALPGILITDVSQTKELIDYYSRSTKRDWAGRPTAFLATASIADGLAPILHNSAPQVALFSSRGPDVKDFSFEDADVLKPDILAPGSLIWAAWAPNGTDEANYEGQLTINQRVSVAKVEK